MKTALLTTLVAAWVHFNLQAQWTKTAGPEGAEVKAFARNSAYLFVATNGGGVYRTTNNGTTWEEANVGLTNKRVFALAVSNDTLYAGTQGSGVYRSINNGSTWIEINNALEGLDVNALLVKDGMLYAGAYEGGLKSLGGVHRYNPQTNQWENVSGNLPENFSVETMVVHNNAIYVGSLFGGSDIGNERQRNGIRIKRDRPRGEIHTLYRTTDNGATWEELSESLEYPYIRTLYSDGNALLLGTDGGGLFRTIDDGATWQSLNTLPILELLPITCVERVGTRLYISAFGTFLKTGFFSGGLFYTDDNGATWQLSLETEVASPPTVVKASNAALMLGTLGGVMRSVDQSATWESVNRGLAALPISSLVWHNGALFAGTDLSGVYRTTNGGITWTQVNSGLVSLGIKSLASIGGKLFAGTSGFGIYVSTNNGETWSVSLPADEEFISVNDFAVNGNDIYVATGDLFAQPGIYRSTDGGNTWSNVTNNLVELGVFFNTIAALNGEVFVGTEGVGVYRSANNGTTWQEANQGLYDETAPAFVNKLFTLNGALYAGMGSFGEQMIETSGVFVSQNGGASWTRTINGLNQNRLRVTTFANSGNTVFAATEAGVYFTTNFGAQWQAAGTSLPTVHPFFPPHIRALATNGLQLYAGLNGESVWQAPISTLNTPRTPEKPTGFRLMQNYPNPFNPTTMIGYELSAASEVTLELFDVLGRKVATLVNGRQNAGAYSYTMNASQYGLATGTYFYRLQVGGVSETKKMLLVK
ncbi:MAG: T9SS type A sorting domain-containing protein [Chloroherpetonaceae bacterium]